MNSSDGLIGLADVWSIVSERRLEAYDYKGILYFKRDEEGVIQESYYPTLESLMIKHPRIDRSVLIVDLSREEN